MSGLKSGFDAILAQHTAVLGKTGSGKTHTAKVIVEEAVRRNARVCILDTIKSDWWGMISSADGKRPGLPFRILGGPRGHVPLSPLAGKAVAQVVANSSLPLSIIDMALFDAGEPQKFFIDFAKALLPAMKGVLYLVIEEAHELAPKERAGFGAENMAIYYAKKLATAGRSRGIRLIVTTQSVQQLHNRVLDSCETMIAHRLTSPASKEPVMKWLKSNVPKDKVEEIDHSLSRQPTGTAWVCSGEAQIFKQIAFPPIHTFDNSATPTDDATVDVTTAKIDTEELTTLLGEAVKAEQAKDPAHLQKEIARLTGELAQAQAAAPAAPVIDQSALIAAEAQGYERGTKVMLDLILAANAKISAQVRTVIDAVSAIDVDAALDTKSIKAPPPVPFHNLITAAPLPPVMPTRQTGPTNGGGTGEKMKKAERSILTALAQYPMGRTKVQVAILTGYSVTGGGFNNALGALRSKQYIIGTDDLQITPAGTKALGSYEPLPRGQALLEHWLRNLGKAEREILTAAVKAYPRHISKEALASHAGYEPTGGGFNNALGKLRTLELITRGSEIRASEALFG